MDSNNRLIAASSLRMFFDDQIHYLQHRIADLIVVNGKQALVGEDQQIVEDFVDLANARMRAVSDYAPRLRHLVRGLYNHVLSLSEQLPAPIELTITSFHDDPLINALFVSSHDFEQLLKLALTISPPLVQHDTPVYALLTAYKSEKQLLGVGFLGDMLVRDLPQQAVNFSGHKLDFMESSSEQLNCSINTYLFKQSVTLIKQAMNQRLCNEQLSDQSYQSRLTSLANPEVYLTTLSEYLQDPELLVSLNKSHLTLSKQGIKLTSDHDQCANEFDVYELQWANHARYIVVPVKHRS